MKNKILNYLLISVIMLFVITVLKKTYNSALNVYAGEVTPEAASPAPTVTPEAATSLTPTVIPTPVVNSVKVSVNYTTGILTVQAGPGGSNKLYFSTDKKKTWELIETMGGIIDIRSLIKSSAVALYFKGNKDHGPVEFVIPAEDKNLKVAYSVVNGAGTITYANASGQIEYRAGANEQWNNIPANGAISTQLYEVTGATLQFRIKATENVRAGKIVSLKIPKRAKAPTIKVNGSKLTFTGLKGGVTQYRINDNTEWIPFGLNDTKAKELSIAALAIPIAVEQNIMIPKVTVEFRNIATAKSPASAIRTIELEAQRDAPTTAVVSLEGTTLTILDAASKNPYEILVMHIGEKPNLDKDKWKTVTSQKGQIIKKTGTADTIPGDLIYVRYKAGKDSLTGIESMASKYMVLEVKTITSTSTSKTTPVPTLTTAPSITPEVSVTPGV